MGVLAWLVTGTIVAVAVRAAAGARLIPAGSGSLLAGAAGGLLGGFISDLTIRGDSVMNFRGPTLIGAIVGSTILVALVYVASLRRNHRSSAAR
jgi:hypothetical protein